MRKRYLVKASAKFRFERVNDKAVKSEIGASNETAYSTADAAITNSISARNEAVVYSKYDKNSFMRHHGKDNHFT